MAILTHLTGIRYEFRGGKGNQAVVEISDDGTAFRALHPIAPPNQKASATGCSNVEYLLSLGNNEDRRGWAESAKKRGPLGARITIVARRR